MSLVRKSFCEISENELKTKFELSEQNFIVRAR